MSDVAAGWYADPDDESQLRFWDGAQWTDERLPVKPSQPSPPTTAPVAVQDDQPEGADGDAAKPKAKSGKGGWVVLAVGLLIVVFAVKSCAGGGSSSDYSAEVVWVKQINPAAVNVAVRVTNNGDSSGTPDCTINVSDPSGAYTGFDVFTPPSGSLGPGESTGFNGTVTVTNQGARYVTKATVDCS